MLHLVAARAFQYADRALAGVTIGEVSHKWCSAYLLACVHADIVHASMPCVRLFLLITMCMHTMHVHIYKQTIYTFTYVYMIYIYSIYEAPYVC